MVSSSLLVLTSCFAVGAFADGIYPNSTQVSISATPCASVLTTVLFPQPTLCSCPGNDVLNDLITAENGVRDSVGEVLEILQGANITLTQVEDVLDVLDRSMSGLANLANGVACVGPEFVSIFSNIIQTLVQAIGIIEKVATGNALGTIEGIFDILQSIGKSVAAVVDAIKTIIENRDLLACFGCQEIDSLNNMIFVLEAAAKRIIPRFPSLPRLPACSGPTTSITTVSGFCDTAPTAAVSAGSGVQCTRTYTLSAPPVDPTLCPCTEDEDLNGIITNIQNVINFVKGVISILPPLPGPLGTITSKVLPEAINSLTTLLNVIFGAGCLGSFAGPLISAFKSLITQILSLIKLLQQASTDPSPAIDAIVSIVTALLNVSNSLIHQLYSIIKSDSLHCFACSDIFVLNSLITSVNDALSRLPNLSGAHLTLLPACDASVSVFASIVPCPTAA